MITKIEARNTQMLNVTDKISFMQRQILIHSYLYYHLDRTVITDKQYDSISYKLVELMKQYTNETLESDYAEIFKDFDGNTGFDLIGRLSKEQLYRVDSIARYLMKTSKRR